MAATDSLKVFAIGGRTDSTGAAAVDVDQEELRMLAAAGLTAGYLRKPDGSSNPNAFTVAQNTGTDMNVKVGSGTSKNDALVLRSSVAGQGAYIIRLDATTKTLAVPAADATNPARYGVYAFIDDAAYSGDASRAYANLSCIRGTPAGSPTTPGPLGVWSTSFLLWEFQLAANATAVTTAILTAGIDQRFPSVPILGAGGRVAYVENTSLSQGSIVGSATDVTGLSTSFLVRANRRYRIAFQLHALSTVATDALRLQVTNSGGTTLGLTQDFNVGNTTGGIPVTCGAARDFTALTPGVQSLKLQALRAGGSGTLQLTGGDGVSGHQGAAWLGVEDLGPA